MTKDLQGLIKENFGSLLDEITEEIVTNSNIIEKVNFNDSNLNSLSSYAEAILEKLSGKTPVLKSHQEQIKNDFGKNVGNLIIRAVRNSVDKVLTDNFGKAK